MATGDHGETGTSGAPAEGGRRHLGLVFAQAIPREGETFSLTRALTISASGRMSIPRIAGVAAAPTATERYRGVSAGEGSIPAIGGATSGVGHMEARHPRIPRRTAGRGPPVAASGHCPCDGTTPGYVPQAAHAGVRRSRLRLEAFAH